MSLTLTKLLEICNCATVYQRLRDRTAYDPAHGTMDSERPAVRINGHAIVEGTSLFHTRTSEVYWVNRIGDGNVVLEGLDAQPEMNIGEFRGRIIREVLVVEAGRPDKTE